MQAQYELVHTPFTSATGNHEIGQVCDTRLCSTQLGPESFRHAPQRALRRGRIDGHHVVFGVMMRCCRSIWSRGSAQRLFLLQPVSSLAKSLHHSAVAWCEPAKQPRPLTSLPKSALRPKLSLNPNNLPPSSLTLSPNPASLLNPQLIH